MKLNSGLLFSSLSQLVKRSDVQGLKIIYYFSAMTINFFGKAGHFYQICNFMLKLKEPG